MRQGDSPATHLPACCAILLGCLGWALWRGEDVNWDLQNYHLYDAFASLYRRGVRDAAPAGPQSFLNPLPYMLPYAARGLLSPRAAALAVAASQSVTLMLGWGIAWKVCRRKLPAVLATLAASTGPVVLIELGTSLADLSLASLPLASILLMRRPLLAGMLTGAAIGMKPTSLFLLPALLAFAAMLQTGGRAAIHTAAWVLAGAVLGDALSDGAWAISLWRQYGSPVFPFMNTLFRSHSAARIDFSDLRFRFQGLRHALAIPFALAGGSAVTGEMPIRDARLAVAVCFAVPWLVATMLRRPGRPLLRRPLLGALSAYLLIGLSGWLLLCPIERYAAVLEILCGLLAVLLPAALLGSSQAEVPLLLLATALLMLTTRTADYFHRPWAAAARLRVPTAIGPGATYGLLSYPLADWVTVSPVPVRSFGLFPTMLETGGVLARRVDGMLQAGRGRLWLLSLDVPLLPEIREEMRIHGIVRAPPCLRAATLFWINTVFCRGVLSGPRLLAASDLPLGTSVAFSTHGDGLIYELDGFLEAASDSTWATGSVSRLALHLDTPTRRSGAILSLHLAGVYGGPVRRVMVSVGDAAPVAVRLGPPTYVAEPAVPIPPQPKGHGTIVVRFATGPVQSPASLHLGPDPRPLSFTLYSMRLHAAPSYPRSGATP